MGKLEVLNAFSASAFARGLAFRNPRLQRPVGKVRAKKDVPLVEEDQAREYLSKLAIHKAMDPDGMHREILRQLADDWETTLNYL